MISIVYVWGERGNRGALPKASTAKIARIICTAARGRSVKIWFRAAKGLSLYNRYNMFVNK